MSKLYAFVEIKCSNEGVITAVLKIKLLYGYTLNGHMCNNCKGAKYFFSLLNIFNDKMCGNSNLIDNKLTANVPPFTYCMVS